MLTRPTSSSSPCPVKPTRLGRALDTLVVLGSNGSKRVPWGSNFLRIKKPVQTSEGVEGARQLELSPAHDPFLGTRASLVVIPEPLLDSARARGHRRQLANPVGARVPLESRRSVSIFRDVDAPEGIELGRAELWMNAGLGHHLRVLLAECVVSIIAPADRRIDQTQPSSQTIMIDLDRDVVQAGDLFDRVEGAVFVLDLEISRPQGPICLRVPAAEDHLPTQVQGQGGPDRLRIGDRSIEMIDLSSPVSIV